MKGVVAACIIAAVVVVGSILYTNRVDKISEEIMEMNASVTQKLEEEDYGGASEEIGRLNTYIDDNRTFLSATGNHEQLDKIELNIMELWEYTKGEQQADALSRCRILSAMLEYLPRENKITLENIL